MKAVLRLVELLAPKPANPVTVQLSPKADILLPPKACFILLNKVWLLPVVIHTLQSGSLGVLPRGKNPWTRLGCVWPLF